MTESSAVRKMLLEQSRSEGVKMNDPASRAKIKPFMELHGLKEEDFKLKVSDYPHFNAFFYRQLKEGSRPVDAPDQPGIAVSPADSRMTVFPHITEATKVWIKGNEFTVDKLLASRSDLAALYHDGTLVIARLAPQDYHRFHFPVTGSMGTITEVNGTLYTVNPIAVRQPINVYTENIRHILELHSDAFGTVVMIAVGATMVGSVNVLEEFKTPGARFQKGDEAGFFAFGGSTTLTLFPKGSITLDRDLVENSMKPLEVLVRVGQRIGEHVAP